MNDSPLNNQLTAIVQQPDRASGEPAWLNEARDSAAKKFASHGVPTRKAEDWRYTRFEALADNNLQRAARPTQAPTPEQIDSLCGENAIRLVIHDGFVDTSASQLDDLPQGLAISSLSAALAAEPENIRTWFGNCGANNDEAFPALNTVLMQDGVFIHVAPDAQIETPIEIIYLNSNQDAPLTCAPRNLVVVSDNAQLTLVEHVVGANSATAHFTDVVTEISLADNARLTHYRLQNLHHEAFYIDHVFSNQAPGSHYQALTINLGGRTARSEYHANFTAPGATCNLDGLYLAGDKQVTDIHTKLYHTVPGCNSEQRFKGILAGKGRAVFDGLIRVEKDAQQTAAHLKNDNLLLTRDAEIDTKPQLEIFADDVQCSHGTTVGQLDPEHLFYLRSRGIVKQQAYRMLCLGFAGEILEDCQLSSFKERVIKEVAERLHATMDI